MHRFILFLFISLMLGAANLNAQHLFHKTFSNMDAIYSSMVSGLPDGSYVVVSNIGSPGPQYGDLMITHYGPCDEINWTQVFDIDTMQLQAVKVVSASNGEILVAGTYGKYKQFDMFLLKLTASGDVGFFKHYGGIYDDYVISIGGYSDGGYFLHGLSKEDGTDKMFLMRIDESGNRSWLKEYEYTASFEGSAIPVSDGGVLVRSAGLVFKTDGNGTVQWAYNMVTAPGQYFVLTDPVEVTDGYVYMRHAYGEPLNDMTGMFKIDFNGQLLWKGEKSITGKAFSIFEQENGQFVVVAEKYTPPTSDYYLVFMEFDDQGKVLREVEKIKPNGEEMQVISATQMVNGDILVTGLEKVETTSIYRRPYLLRTNSSLDLAGCGQVNQLPKGSELDFSWEVTTVTTNPWFNIGENLLTAMIHDTTIVHETICSLDTEYELELGNDTVFCGGGSIELSGGQGFPKYYWSTGETTSSITVDTTGTYILEAGDGCTNVRDTVRVVIYPALEPRFSVEPLETTPLDKIYFSSDNPGVDVYWDYVFGNSTLAKFSYTYNENGVFPVVYRITDAFGCTYSDTIEVTINYVSYYIPKGFTPDGDGINDNFKPEGFGIYYHMNIYTRWGNVIYSEQNGSWDGNFEGKAMPQDGYVYEIKIYDDFGKNEVKRGVITLLR